jgi:uncharacterized protein with NRDE domain
MCTILIARRLHPRFPLILAANRDEFHARPSAPPGVLDAAHDVLGGKDLVGGGTWLGVARRRFVTAVTNHRNHRPPDPSRASRGALVMDLLRTSSADRAAEAIAGSGISAYNEANLLFGHAEDLRVAYLRDHAPPRVLDVPAGLSVLTNGELTERDEFPKIERLAALASPLADDPEVLVASLFHALGDHHKPALDAVPSPPAGSIFTRELLRELHAICVHTAGYGTVSSSVVLFDDAGLARWEHSEGPPCTSARSRFL